MSILDLTRNLEFEFGGYIDGYNCRCIWVPIEDNEKEIQNDILKQVKEIIE